MNDSKFNDLYNKSYGDAYTDLLIKHHTLYIEKQKLKEEEYKKMWIVKNCFRCNLTEYLQGELINSTVYNKSQEMFKDYVKSIDKDLDLIASLLKTESERLNSMVKDNN